MIESVSLTDGKKQYRVPQLLVGGSRYVLFMFYPANFTFVCPTEIMELDGLVEQFLEVGCETFAVSGDSSFCHWAWLSGPTTVGGLGGMVNNVTLLSDPDFQLANMFEAKKPEKNLMKRKTVIFDRKTSEVVYETTNPDDVGRNLEDTLRVLKSLIALKDNPEEFCPRRSLTPLRKEGFSFLEKA